jgi:two-component system nitrogen regulation response regulator GlnG
MTERKSDPLSLGGATWKKPAEALTAGRSVVPCLTICCHADLGRIGERALLRGLLVRMPVEVSRLSLEFQPVAGGEARPLLDPYVSRTPVRIVGEPRRGLSIEYERDDLRIDGQRASAAHAVSPAELARGVVLELGDRVVLLLHTSEGRGSNAVPGLLGDSDAMAQIRREIDRVAELELPVLLRGESGSGKERVAHRIHERSARRQAALVAVNMATIPPSTAVSTLFGHAKGAFTGAQQRHVGLFERAHGGTLFLDEIGETPDEVQPMLLRVLETGRVTPLGESAEHVVDVRVIAATDADLEHDTEHGHFRRALLHRLAGYELRLPSLRERREDIPQLFLHFLREELAATGDSALLTSDATDAIPRIPARLMTRLLLHRLDGNVRQLRNIVRRLAVASHGGNQLVVEPTLDSLLGDASEDLTPSSDREHASAAADLGAGSRRPMEIDETQLIAALEASEWAPGRTAAALGISTSSLHDLMRKAPGIRKAKDVADQELREAMQAAHGDTRRMAQALRVSERALKMTLKERGLLPR